MVLGLNCLKLFPARGQAGRRAPRSWRLERGLKARLMPTQPAMTTTYKVGHIVGSLSKASINRKLALALTRLAPKELQFQDIPIGNLPLYDYELEKAFPAPAKAFKDQIAALDAVVFVTPEYNRSIPGVLKNAIDWASRPYGQNSFARKPSTVIGTSPGK